MPDTPPNDATTPAQPRVITAELVPLSVAQWVVPLAPPAPPPVPSGPERVTVTTAEPFVTVPLETALAQARSVSVADVCAWVGTGPKLLFDDCRDETSRSVAVVSTQNAVPPNLWIVGDLHADVLTLANIIQATESLSNPEPAHFVFLGDFVDRGVHDHETLLLLFGLMMRHPERVCLVPGNHDVDLIYGDATGRFHVTIAPAEYCDALTRALGSGAPDDRERVELAKAFVAFCATRPRAVFLPDGTLVAHGGFPHTDVQKDLQSRAGLCSARSQDDFLWARIAETARVKRPNRGSRGHEFGWSTLAQFAEVCARFDIPLRRFVRGHDHVPDRWEEYPEYANNGVPVLTLNAMGRALDGDAPRRDGARHPFPVVGRCRDGHLPDVVRLPLDPAEVDRAFPRPHAENGS